ncbi:MAG: tagaturonate reductase [Defluviitaleaceae bacterium]|nr:tagaturonate reductase [Defluviitaleaceae bacterium]
MPQLNRDIAKISAREEKILQFGEGNFLRAFIDSFVDELNGKGLFDGGIVIVQPVESFNDIVKAFNEQDGCYTVVLRGLENGKPVSKQQLVTSVTRILNPYTEHTSYMDNIKNPSLRYIISNTTEAGIVYVNTEKPNDGATRPPASFPAKITAFLYERYKFFSGAVDKGFIFIPCELIDNNGTELKAIVLRHAKEWGLPREFTDWVEKHNHFTNTLVDRIVTGYPKDEAAEFEKALGYRDDFLVTGEIFHFFVIEAGKEAAEEINRTLPFAKAGLNVVLTDDVTPYKLRKVRILNGAHTMSVLAAYLCGKETVGDMMADELFVKFLKQGIYKEIIPATKGKGLDESDLLSFADSVFDRFANPHIKHYLLSIALNSVAKFKARVLPSILDYHKLHGDFPAALTLSLAALITFYNTDKASDDEAVLAFFKIIQGEQILANVDFWGQDLTALPGFADKIKSHLQNIEKHGMKAEIESILKLGEH